MNRLFTPTFVTRKRSKLQKRVRICLMCGRSFKSEGPQNRRCPRCNYLLDHAREGTYYEPVTYSTESYLSSESFDTL